MKEREYYLDNLKVFLTLLVIFYHAGLAYVNYSEWPYIPSNTAEHLIWIRHYFSVHSGFIMVLFFLISGYFIPRSYDRQGEKAFVKKKLIRLGIPLLIMGGITSAIKGSFEAAHMWYVESLLLLCLLYALTRKVCKPITRDCSSKPTINGLIILGLIIGIGSFFIQRFSPIGHWLNFPLKIEPAHYLQYVVMFCVGIISGRFNWFEKMSNRTGTISFLIGVALAVGIYAMGDNLWSRVVRKLYFVYESYLCVFMSFGLIWFFRQFLDKTSPFLKWCSTQSYGVYIFHILIMLGIQYATDGIWMGAVGKYIFVGVATTIVSFCFTWLVRMIPGVKKVI